MITFLLSKKKLLRTFSALVLIAYITLSWCVRIDDLPGLHGDEAWAALKAMDFNKSGTTQWTGMNHYTGILQIVFVQYCFELLGAGVWQLRIPGILINFLALAIFYRMFLKYTNFNRSLFFLLILSQSALLLISPRIAWEVNTLTLALCSLVFTAIASYHDRNSTNKTRWILLFWVANLIGSYNHLIFSCLSLALITGLIFWSIYYQSRDYNSSLVILGINAANVIGLYALMKFLGSSISHGIYIIPFLVILLLLELKMISCLIRKTRTIRFFIAIDRRWLKLALSFLVIIFIYFHGEAYFEVLSAHKLFLMVYSYELPALIVLLLTILAVAYSGFLIRYLIVDFTRDTKSVFPFVIVTYGALLCGYTTQTSYRYYLTFFILSAIYLALRVTYKDKFVNTLTYSLLLTFLLIAIIQMSVLTNASRKVKAIDFVSGRNLAETSAHFLPKQPLIDSLVKYQIANIEYATENNFLISEPVKFYHRMFIWKSKSNNSAIVSYDFKNYGTGYIIHINSF